MQKPNTSGQSICAKCGKLVNYLIENLCLECYNLKCQNNLQCFNCGQSVTYLIYGLCQSCYDLRNKNRFNYKCSDCHGEFNNPSYGQGYSNCLNAKCPWCGRELKGML